MRTDRDLTPHDLHSGLDYRTPDEVRRTWEDLPQPRKRAAQAVDTGAKQVTISIMQSLPDGYGPRRRALNRRLHEDVIRDTDARWVGIWLSTRRAERARAETALVEVLACRRLWIEEVVWCESPLAVAREARRSYEQGFEKPLLVSADEFAGWKDELEPLWIRHCDPLGCARVYPTNALQRDIWVARHAWASAWSDAARQDPALWRSLEGVLYDVGWQSDAMTGVESVNGGWQEEYARLWDALLCPRGPFPTLPVPDLRAGLRLLEEVSYWHIGVRQGERVRAVLGDRPIGTLRGKDGTVRLCFPA